MSREYSVLVVATLVWGSVHPTVKFALTELTSLQLALLRPVFACCVLMLLVVVSGRTPQLKRDFAAAPRLLLALGVLGYAMSGTLTSLALALLPAGITSLMTNTSPLVLVLGGLFLFHQQIGLVEILGTLIGFGGVALLSVNDLRLS